jgi:hypothetical protein
LQSLMKNSQEKRELSPSNNWIGYLKWLGVTVEETAYRQKKGREED